MDSSFSTYMQQLELLAFFSGYPLIYLLTLVIAGNASTGKNLSNRIYSLLPFAYALVGTLYLAYQIRNLHPDYSLSHIQLSIQQPFWTIWALLSILFWLPALQKKPVLSIFHSLPFFLLLVYDLFQHTIHFQQDNSVVRNDMKIYTDSLLLHLFALAFVTLVFFLVKFIEGKSRRHP